jgi:hypothetical protein
MKVKTYDTRRHIIKIFKLEEAACSKCRQKRSNKMVKRIVIVNERGEVQKKYSLMPSSPSFFQK